MPQEMLILPQQYPDRIVRWPFTKFSRSLDNNLRENGMPLVERSFEADSETINLFRSYVLPDNKGPLVYVRGGIGVPKPIDESRGSGDFAPEDVTWVNNTPYISAETLTKKLKDTSRGYESIWFGSEGHYHCDISGGKELFDIEIQAGTEEFIGYAVKTLGLESKFKEPHMICSNSEGKRLSIENTIQLLFKILAYRPS